MNENKSIERYAIKDNFVRIEDLKPPKTFVCCAFCKNGIEFRGLPVFPICENCRKILGELVASHKSNWVTDK
ncbi:MAG: hypothetical protein IKI31_02640 [Treponema sp.]|nr:hypothetical protein [Treponema sp.]